MRSCGGLGIQGILRRGEVLETGKWIGKVEDCREFSGRHRKGFECEWEVGDPSENHPLSCASKCSMWQNVEIQPCGTCTVLSLLATFDSTVWGSSPSNLHTNFFSHPYKPSIQITPRVFGEGFKFGNQPPKPKDNRSQCQGQENKVQGSV